MTSPAWSRSGPFSGGSGREAALRRDAGRILEAGIAAADPAAAVAAAMDRRAASMGAARRVFIVAIGKASEGMVHGALPFVADSLAGGVVIAAAPAETPDARLSRLMGDHPLPGRASSEAGEAVKVLAAEVAAGDRVLCLISGGASALAVLPAPGITVAELARVTDALLRAGAPIGELNTVRRRLDALKGGGLAALLVPGEVIGLLVSDVPGDRPEDIASGPLLPDPTDAAAARAVLERHGLLGAVPASVLKAMDEAPRVEPPPVDLEIVASAGQALSAAAAEAAALGYSVDCAPDHVAGEARGLGRRLATRIVGGTGRRAMLRAGETTVTVRGRGRGGRNQEVALGAVTALAGTSNALVAAMGTDGVDGPTDAAGAVAASTTAARASAAGLVVDRALADNDAHGFFAPLGDLIRSGPTGTNVMDLYLALADD